MSSLSQIWSIVTDKILTSEREQPSAVTIPLDNIDRKEQMKDAFAAGKDYFQVRINQLFLKNEREWFTQIDPMVSVVSEFQYNGKPAAVASVVGPNKQSCQQLPHGMIFSNVKVAGLHPYRGDAVKLSVVLCQVPVGSPAKVLLSVIEQASKVFDFATALGPYLAIGNVVLNGIDKLLGLDGTLPLIGLQTTFDPQAGDPFRPSYFALIDKQGVSPNEFGVANNTLIKDGKENREADFVLYSIVRSPDGKRSDIEQLPFYNLWDSAVKEAMSLKEGSWDTAKGDLLALLSAIRLSPDLTFEQADELICMYPPRLKSMYEAQKKASTLGKAKEATGEEGMDSVRKMAASILSL
jgi:hypothetical protein